MGLIKKLKNIVIGEARSPLDRRVFHNISLAAFFAWVGLGADGLSSSCYGPEEAFLALGTHYHLSLFVAIATGLTVLLISSSYSQIIELFPSGGGGYLVASKLLNPTLGMISGCALLIDYVLTITISIASSTDAIFSFFPAEYGFFKIYVAVFGILFLTILNMRGVKESIIPLVPIFITFLVTHFILIVYALSFHAFSIPEVLASTKLDMKNTYLELGLGGTIFLILRAYSLGAGTYTGIEAVSNGLPILKEPKVETGKRTMIYMSWSLALTVMGLMVSYLLFNVEHVPGKTLNATLFENIVEHWHGPWGGLFVLITLISEALLLFVAAQAGFLGGPRVMASMALDRWFPNRFAALSERLVNQNGVLWMGLAAFLILLYTHGSVKVLVVLYSINVFITFCFSQGGMVRHWWTVRLRSKGWKRKMLVSGAGFLLTTFILFSVIILKFHEGGWVTLVITGGLVTIALFIKSHYNKTAQLLKRLNTLTDAVAASSFDPGAVQTNVTFDTNSKTAVILVNGFNGLGLHTLFNVIKFFGKEFRNFVFIQIGVIDAGNFKGIEEVARLESQIKSDIQKYVAYMQNNGYYAEGVSAVGIDPIEEVERISLEVLNRFPSAVFFGGQLVFPEESFWTRYLHNNTVFTMQRRFYHQGIPLVILPIRV